MASDFYLACQDQKYDHSISKSEANEHERVMTQMKYDQEYRMKQLEYDSNNKDMGISDNTPFPPANVTDETDHRYLSWFCIKQASSTLTLQFTIIWRREKNMEQMA